MYKAIIIHTNYRKQTRILHTVTMVLLLTVQNSNIMNRQIYFTKHEGSWDSVVGTVNRLRCEWPRNYASQFLARKEDFYLFR